jgi:hypothetical protein
VAKIVSLEHFIEHCYVYPTFNPKSYINESLRHGSISSNRIYGKGSIRFKCRCITDNTIMNYDKEWGNEASLEDIKEFKQYALTYFLQK